MVATRYTYQLWSAAQETLRDDNSGTLLPYLAMQQLGQLMSGNPAEVTGGMQMQDDTHIYRLSAAPITDEGKALADAALAISPLPDGLYYWLGAKQFDEGDTILLVETNHQESQASIGQPWNSQQCWDAIGIESITTEEELQR